MSSSSAPPSTPEGPGSVSGAPNLPAGFTDTFTSHYIDTGGLRQHAVIGGEGRRWTVLAIGGAESWGEPLAALTAFLAPYRDRG